VGAEQAEKKRGKETVNPADGLTEVASVVVTRPHWSDLRWCNRKKMSNCSKRVLHSSKRLCAVALVYLAWQTPQFC
jgi:hypothetical protein